MLTECPECGYSLQGLPTNHNCPECGLAYDEQSESYPWLGSRRGKLIVLIAFPCMLLFQAISRLNDLTKGSIWWRRTMGFLWVATIAAGLWGLWSAIRIFRNREVVAILPGHLLIHLDSPKPVKIEWHKIARVEPHYAPFKSAVIYLHEKEAPLIVSGVFHTHEHVLQFIEMVRARVKQADRHLEPNPET